MEQFKHLIVTNKHTSAKVGYADKWDTVLLGGMVGSLFSLLQFIVSPIIGRASDRLGRRTVLLYTMVNLCLKPDFLVICHSNLFHLSKQVGNILSTLIWLFAGNFTLFLIARVVAGLSEGNVQLSIAIISDVTTPEKRSRSLVREKKRQR